MVVKAKRQLERSNIIVSAYLARVVVIIVVIIIVFILPRLYQHQQACHCWLASLVRTVVGDIINITLTTAVNIVLKVFTTISALVIFTITNAAMVVDCFGKNIINIIARHL